MSQTDIVFGAILVAFLVFVTLRQTNGKSDLTQWLSLMGL